MSDSKEKFYRHFRTAVTEILDQIQDLKTVSHIGGERRDCIDIVLAGISRLNNEVNDALDYIPPYDQRAYAEAIKALTEKLNEATGSLAPGKRFQFKQREPAPDAPPQQDPRRLFTGPPFVTSGGNDGAGGAAAAEARDSVGPMNLFSGIGSNNPKDYNDEIAAGGRPGAGGSSVRKPSFSAANKVFISDQKNVHVMLPASASRATSSGSLTNLERSIVDMTVPTTGGEGKPFAQLVVKNVKKSLLICGTVSGAVHITNVEDSVVVVAARQVRVHDCKGTDVYVYCGSHPIIEDCKGMRFAPIPESYMRKTEMELSTNRWDQVQDFKWLKSEPSPNWNILPKEKRIPTNFWEKILSKPGLSAGEILREAGLKD